MKNKNETLDYEYVIIGFGASGIAAAIQLLLAKKSFKIIEKTSYFGGCWNLALPSSCLQTHRAFYKFSTVDYDQGTSAFPNKLEILNYFKKAIDIYNLFNHVEFNYEAKYKRYKTHWLVNSGSLNEISCNHILDCSGVNRIPNIPTIFQLSNINNDKTHVIHTCDFNKFIENSIEKYKKIIIVGNGASCCDILKYFSYSPGFSFKETEIKVLYRNDKYFIPTTIKGIPGSVFLSNTLLKIFEKVPLKVFIFFIILANMFVFKSYLPVPNNKINSYNIVGSKIIQQLIKGGKISYHKEEIKNLDLKNKIVTTNDAIYSGIDLIILATGYKETIDKPLFEYVIPVDTENSIKTNNIGFIGFNRTYNFIENSESRSKWYIENNHRLDEYKKNGIIGKWIDKIKKRKSKNNLNFLDATYELFELDIK